jgi:hypothetical protein
MESHFKKLPGLNRTITLTHSNPNTTTGESKTIEINPNKHRHIITF